MKSAYLRLALFLEHVRAEHWHGAFEVVVGVGRLADGANLALLDERVHGGGGLAQVVVVRVVVAGADIGAVVEVVDVDVVGAEVAERLLALVADVRGS
jgi:hypothetical protein